jgi:hypothetical protein
VRNNVLFEGHNSGKSEFSRWRRLNLYQIDLFSLDDETHVSLKRKPSVLVAAASITLFPCDN